MTVKAIDPKPLYGAEIPPARTGPHGQGAAGRPACSQRFHGQPAGANESRLRQRRAQLVRSRADPELPGDDEARRFAGLDDQHAQGPECLHAQLRNKIERGVEDSSPIRTAAVLTCVAAPQPPDAFRPAFCDRQQRIYLARNLKRELLPTAAAHPGAAQRRPVTSGSRSGPGWAPASSASRSRWRTCRSTGWNTAASPGISALLLCTDLKPEQKEPLLVNLRPGGHRPGGHDPRRPSRLDRLGRARQRAQAAHRLRRSCCWATTSWPTSTSPFPRRASARTSRPPMAIAGPARRWFSPGIRESTRPPGAVETWRAPSRGNIGPRWFNLIASDPMNQNNPGNTSLGNNIPAQAPSAGAKNFTFQSFFTNLLGIQSSTPPSLPAGLHLDSVTAATPFTGHLQAVRVDSRPVRASLWPRDPRAERLESKRPGSVHLADLKNSGGSLQNLQVDPAPNCRLRNNQRHSDSGFSGGLVQPVLHDVAGNTTQHPA